MTNPFVVTVDVEDWPQSTLDRALPITSRVVRNTGRLLDTLAGSGVRATFFVLGPIAERFPELVRRCHAAGHEIASHGCAHLEVFRQGPAEFRADVRRAKAVLEDCIGERVVGYRAPDFSVVRSTLWALEVLAEEGYLYDSSIFPMRTRRYGIGGWPRKPAAVRFGSGTTIIELPVGVWERGPLRLPVGGGGYHRLLPGAVSRAFIRNSLATAPFVFYCHPYEIDPRELAELDVRVPPLTRIHQGLGRSRFQGRLRHLFAEFGGLPARDLLASGVRWSCLVDAIGRVHPQQPAGAGHV